MELKKSTSCHALEGGSETFVEGETRGFQSYGWARNVQSVLQGQASTLGEMRSSVTQGKTTYFGGPRHGNMYPMVRSMSHHASSK